MVRILCEAWHRAVYSDEWEKSTWKGRLHERKMYSTTHIFCCSMCVSVRVYSVFVFLMLIHDAVYIFNIPSFFFDVRLLFRVIRPYTAIYHSPIFTFFGRKERGSEQKRVGQNRRDCVCVCVRSRWFLSIYWQYPICITQHRKRHLHTHAHAHTLATDSLVTYAYKWWNERFSVKSDNIWTWIQGTTFRNQKQYGQMIGFCYQKMDQKEL